MFKFGRSGENRTLTILVPKTSTIPLGDTSENWQVERDFNSHKIFWRDLCYLLHHLPIYMKSV